MRRSCRDLCEVSYGSRMGEAAIYSIGAVARMVGVSVSTLRTWEERYRVVVATRSAGGQRRYSREQLAQLRFVVGEIADGMSPGDAHRVLTHAGRASAGGREGEAGPADPGVLILIADRDPYAASIVDYFLRTEGYRVELVRNAAEAERQLEVLSPGVVVVELLLSGGLGSPLFSRLGESDAMVIAVSPLAAGEIAAELGAHAFLQKPIDPVVLISTIRDLLGTSALLRPAIRLTPS
jgi:DNA-binding transcriptional MerR regulator